MRRFITRRPSPSLLVSLCALIVAVGGTAVAATTPGNGDKLIQEHTLSGNRLRSHTVTRQQIKISALGKVPSAHHADVADNATNATNAEHATNADQATNADNATNAAIAQNSQLLAGIGPTEYQRVCQPGAVAAYVYVKGNATFSGTYTSTGGLQDQFNCTGGTVEVKRTGAGTYDVHFGGLDNGGELVATGNQTVMPNGTQVAGGEITYKLIADASLGATVYQVKLFDTAGTAVDNEFSFALLSPQ